VPQRVSQAAPTARPAAPTTRVDPAAAPTRIEAPVPPPVAPEPSATAAMPVIETNPRSEPIVPLAAAARPSAARKQLGKVPIWMRFLIWIVAMPLAFIIVFVLARALGVFTSSQLSDVFLATDADRFWPVARVLPFVALLTAMIVQAGVYAIARLRGGRSR
jgi:hypothetical protein